jgi:hypothetical protein
LDTMLQRIEFVEENNLIRLLLGGHKPSSVSI